MALASLVVLAVAGVGAWWLIWPRTMLGRLAAIGLERGIAPQTSLAVRYHECVVGQSDSLIPGATCTHHPNDDAAVRKLVIDANAKLDDAPDADALLTLAMVAMHRSGEHGSHLSEAVEDLDSALRITHDSAEVMTDLAAAYLMLAAQSQSSQDLNAALEWSDRALELRPGYAPALFNRALVLETMMADYSAMQAWRDYLAADEPDGIAKYLPWRSERSWRAEAEQRLRNLEEQGVSPLPRPTAADTVWQRYVSQYPQRARRYGWETVLPEWAEAFAKGDGRRAAARLHLAEVIGDAVFRRPSGDAMLRDQVSEISGLMQRGGDVNGVVQAYGVEKAAADARQAFGSLRADSLLSRLDRRALPRPQAIWVSLRHAANLIDLSQWDTAKQVLNTVDTQIDTVRYPVAAGYSRWLRGTVYSRNNDYAAATTALQSAHEFYVRTGELASRARVEALIADAQAHSGNADAASEWLQLAARSARELGPSVTLHDTRRIAAMLAQAAGFHRAMHDMASEDLAVAESLGETAFIDEALLNRAVLMAAGGDKARALGDMRRASPPALSPMIVREFMEMASAYTRALVLLDTHPDSVAATVRPLVAYRGSELWRTSGLALRARAAVARGDVARATEDLDSVFVAMEGRASSRGAMQRWGLDDVRPALLRLVALRAKRGDTLGALRLLNRGTAALSPIHDVEPALPRTIPEGRVVIRPLLADSMLLVWVMTGSTVDLTRTPVDPDRLRSTIAQVQSDMARGWNVDTELTELSRLLIAPAERRLGSRGTQIVLVYDDDLGRIPFVALRKRADQPLVMNHPVWSAVSLAAAAAPADTTLPDSVAFFAPKFEPGLNPLLDSLQGAGDEVRNAAQRYGSRVMAVDSQTPQGFLNALSRAGMVHFAGHAVSDEFRPERSYLVLEPGQGWPSGHLMASSLDTFPIPNVRLVVLSACSTLGGSGPSQGFSGLSGALLDAGAHGVVGSLWAVPDSATAALMMKFHDSYRRTHDPHVALWEAQYAMATSGDSTPMVWAAFRYVGR